MASSLGRRAFLNLSRSNVPVAGRNVGRRMMSSSAEHSYKSKSDLPWQIGSALIFGPALVYLLSPTGKEKAAHASADHKRAAHEHKPEPVKVPAAENVSTTEEKTSGDSGSITDSEGTTVSASEVDASIVQAFTEDSPADAQKAEEDQAKSHKTGAGVPTGESPETSSAEVKKMLAERTWARLAPELSPDKFPSKPRRTNDRYSEQRISLL
ncbi:unnamed protein product [Somion occarium]|uniref:Uncharacterized protein n=1 Tax=Somion occarium TaxID=3059160 RepID=A0ABP1DXE6_9APHY